MAKSTLVSDYLGYGLAAARPVTPNTGSGVAPVYYATDTGICYVWDGVAWQALPATPTLCKAWINFGYRAGVLVTDAAQNATVARNGVGDYTISFTSPFAAAVYAVALSFTKFKNSSTITGARFWSQVSQLAGSFRVLLTDGVSAAEDKEWVALIAFGN